MFSKYTIYTPSSEDLDFDFVSKKINYLIEGEFSRSFFSLEKAIEKSFELKAAGNPFVLIEESITGKKRVFSSVIDNKTYFPEEKTVQEESKPIVFKSNGKGKAPNINFNFEGEFMSEGFTSMENYYDMKLLQPVLKDHIEYTLYQFGYNVRDIELLLVAGNDGWYYNLFLNLKVNPFIASTLNIMDVFKKPLYTKTMFDVYDFDNKYKSNKDFYSYFNVACGLTDDNLCTTESKKRMKDFYTNCIAKDWFYAGEK